MRALIGTKIGMTQIFDEAGTVVPVTAIKVEPNAVVGQRLANFIHASTEEVKILTMLSGHRRTQDLSTEDLRAMDVNTAALTGLKLCGYERPLPFWENVYQPALNGNVPK